MGNIGKITKLVYTPQNPEADTISVVRAYVHKAGRLDEDLSRQISLLERLLEENADSDCQPDFKWIVEKGVTESLASLQESQRAAHQSLKRLLRLQDYLTLQSQQ
jgi:hypothetical protein